jgi:uncharacterized Fe-S cluster-containing radical SAM superfamily protein
MKEVEAGETMQKASHQYPAAMANITNRCTLRCKYCFIYREGNPNDPKGEMETTAMVNKLTELQKKHNIETMQWRVVNHSLGQRFYSKVQNFSQEILSLQMAQGIL